MSRLLSCLLLILSGARLSWAEAIASTPPVAEADFRTQRNREKLGRNLVISGTTLSVAAYLTSVATSIVAFSLGGLCQTEPSNQCDDSAKWLWGLLPIAGPWVQVGYSSSLSSAALYGVPGVVQGGGVAMAIVGAVVRNRAVAKLPIVGAYSLPGGVAISVAGRF